jgi:23S rRNA pseudouridine1911/1915/1917 synthase
LAVETEWVWVPFAVDPRYDGLRVDQYLAQRLAAYSRSRVQNLLKDSRVLRGDQTLKASARVRRGDRILIAYPRRVEAPLPANAELPILFEDEALVVVNKPADLLSHPTDKIQRHTVLGLLRHIRPDLKTLHLLHRLDRETSGALALAKTKPAARAWAESMERREIKKEYLAVVKGTPHPREGVIDLPIGRESGDIKVRQGVHVPGASPALTRYKVLESRRAISLVRAYPETGRLHQIRVHLAAWGHPILGDVLYQGQGELYLKMTRRQLTAQDREQTGFHRLALHAARLRFNHPVTTRPLDISALLPADLSDFLENRGMGKSSTLTCR